jgi:NAD(P)H-dependent FMN reductase
MKIQIILGSTRPGRVGEQVAKWVYEQASKRSDFDAELVDIADFNLPLLDEPMPASMQQYTKEHTKKWSEKIAQADGYIFVTAEYNHGIPAAFKNAVDFLYHEWNNKAVGFVSYGGSGGVRAVESWRQIAAELQMADIREHLQFSLLSDFENFSVFKPTEHHKQQLNKLFDQLTAWGKAMQSLRVAKSE